MSKNSNRQKYDLVLVLEFFRSTTYFLNIVKALASKYQIALLCVEADETLLKKNSSGQSDFLNVAKDLGAHILDGSSEIKTNILLVPQRDYKESVYKVIKEKVSYDQITAFLGFAWAGKENQDIFLDKLNIKKAFVVDKDFIHFLLNERNVPNRYDDVELIEVGYPYEDYPLLTDYKADYLLAMPTPFSFSLEQDRWDFIETVLKLLNKLQPEVKVLQKNHNAMDKDHFSSELFRKIYSYIRIIPLINFILKFLATHFPNNQVKTYFARLYTAYLYEELLNKVDDMSCFGEYQQFAMEALLPNIKRGVIGGLSNTIYGSLLMNKPFYNCVDISKQDRSRKDALWGTKIVARVLDQNLKYFMVPFCKGELAFDERHYRIPSTGARNGDLITELKKMLE